MLFVVLVDEVGGDGCRLPERHAGVGIVDGGEATVGVDVDEALSLDLTHLHDIVLVRDVQFVEDDANLTKPE